MIVLKNAVPLSLCLAAEAAWPAADWPHWHRYKCKTADKFGSMDRDRIPPACLAAIDALALAVTPHIGESFIDYDLHAAGLHMMPPGGFLARHLDAECHPIRPWKRTHSIVMSCNSDWRQEYGGELSIEGQAIILPSLGQAVIFETPGAWHEVFPVAELSRKVPIPGMGGMEYNEPICVARKTLALFAWRQERNCEGSTAATFDTHAN